MGEFLPGNSLATEAPSRNRTAWNSQAQGSTFVLLAIWPSGGSTATETTTVPRGDAPPASATKADYIEVTRVAS
jgi:hypothetical protein